LVTSLTTFSPTSSSPPAARSYEGLKGGQGRSIYHRARRYRTRGLLDRIRPALEVDARCVRLFDLSATGLSYWEDTENSVPQAGTRLPVRLSFGDVVAFEAESEIVRHQIAGDRVRVALRFLDDHVIPAKLKALHDRLDFDRSVARGLDVYAAVPAAYRGAIDRARLFVEHWRGLLDAREQALRTSEPADVARLLAETEAGAEERMRTEWQSIHDAANAASREIVEGESLAASKHYTETMLTRALSDVPLVWHTYTKPRGYPGDFEAMTSMYDGQRGGDSIFTRVMDQLGHEERLAATVAIRKRFLVEQLGLCVLEAGKRHDGPVRIVSVGSGPAREVVDYLAATPPGPRLEFVLVDQDEDALSFACDRLREAARPHGDRVRILCRHLSFAELFAMPELVAEVSQADMIYTAGLFDYLGEGVGRALMNGCFGLLRDGGRLVVGNAADGPGVRWMPEFVLDWTMIYRTEAELRDLARDFAGRARIEIDSDESAAWLFLVAQAKAGND
jgi:extracellular factor (EF) 3-hydroxypalmitic acid methyl ester biosynthesis protein